jgi:putative zinc finger/helix-turn-helix YgiT family protein
MRRQSARTPHEVRGLKFEVEGTALVCSKCGFQMIPADLLEEHGRLVDEAYRSAAGLLSADGIRAARSRLGMSQQQFAEYLGVGEASVKRWETGALPEKSSDDLIRLKTDPEFAQRSLEKLCRRLGLSVAPIPLLRLNEPKLSARRASPGDAPMAPRRRKRPALK